MTTKNRWILAWALPLALSAGACSSEQSLTDGMPGGTADPAGMTPGSRTPRSAVPPELAGSWRSGSFSAAGFYNPTTGAWTSGFASGSAYTFTADGGFELGILINTALYNCRTRVFTYKKGTVTVKPGGIDFYPTLGKTRSEDSCVPKYNYERDASLDPESYQWEVTEGASKLTLRSSDGKSFTYQRE